MKIKLKQSSKILSEGPDRDEDIDDLDEALEVIPFTFTITAYGADYPVDSIVKRIEANDIIVPRFNWEDPGSEIVGFQREYVWPRKKADRFIESLLLGLPVPGIFLVKENSGRFLVLDGHQRLFSLHAYYQGIIDKEEYRLEDVQDRFRGKRYRDLDIEDRRRLDDSIIHATVIRQDEPSEDQSSIYMIFERLNTGGVNLQPQEIRVALYHGELVRVLRTLNENRSWRRLYGKKSRRLKDMEMILRFFAFFYYGSSYRSPMKDRHAVDVRHPVDDRLFGVHDFRRGIPTSGVFVKVGNGVGFYELGIIHIARKTALHGFRIAFQGIAGQLNPARQTPGQILHECAGVVNVALPNHKRGNQFAVAVKGDERPNIAIMARLGRVLLLRADKAPNLVDLDFLAGKGAKLGVHDALARFAQPHAKGHDRVAVDARNPLNRPDAGALHQHGNHRDFLFDWKLVRHSNFYVAINVYNN